MTSTIKRWTGLGLGTALLGTALVACGGEGEHGEAGEGELGTHIAGEHGEAGEGEGGEGEGGEAGHAHDIDTLPLPQRLAFMSGHVEAGLALYRAGEPEMAAKHLLHPVSETHAAEREGLDALGFDASLFEAVSAALDEGRPAEEIEPQLQAAEANLAMVTEKAGGSAIEIINYLMDVVVEEYTIAITDGQVTDPGEYQDAYGFSIVAKDRAQQLDEPFKSDVMSKLDSLIALWNGAPVPNDMPAPVAQVSALASTVKLALPQS